ncbi:hypothetical protein FHT82_002500 [Rhizobium sp. BK275]|nr:hypothetical protein [Rhizobium sp. BK275]
MSFGGARMKSDRLHATGSWSDAGGDVWEFPGLIARYAPPSGWPRSQPAVLD